MIGTIHVDIEGGWGGSSRSLYELVKRLDRGRISPVIVYRQIGPVVDWYAALNIPTFHVPEVGSFVPRREKALKSFLASLPALRNLDRAAKRIAEIAERHRSAVVHLNYEGLFLLATKLRQRCALPMIGHSRAHLPVSRWAKWLARRLAASVDHMFFISPQEESRWRELAGNGVPGEVLWNIAREPLPRQPFSDPPEVVYLGNLQRSKGPDRLIDIAAAVAEQGPPPFVFAVYGRARSNPSYVDELKRYCEAKGVARWVQFRGHVSEPETVLARAFALVRSSYENDPWGRDVIEASAAGVPILATGIYDGVVKHDVNGFLFETFDAKSFAAQLTMLQRDDQTWQRLSTSGQLLAREKFGGAEQAERFTRVAEALACRDRTRPRPLDHTSPAS